MADEAAKHTQTLSASKRHWQTSVRRGTSAEEKVGKTRPTGGYLGRLRGWGDTSLQPSHFNPMFLTSLLIV